jgi:hypothetical protein
MAKELKHEASVVRMTLARRDLTLDEARKLLALAATTIPGEIRAKFLRDQGISTVTADVVVEAQGEQGLAVGAVIHVTLTYQGDMVRSSPQVRNKINDRLQDVASKTAMQAVFNEIVSKGKKA